MKFTYPKVVGDLLSLLEGGQLTGGSITAKLYIYSQIELGYSLNELIEDKYVSSTSIGTDIAYKLTKDGVKLLHECMYLADTVVIL